MSTTTATFAMGCFWSPDARFGSTRGVVATRVGYTGGQKSDPTYRSLGDHTESVQVDFDPRQVSYADLLHIFWVGHNPAKPVWGPQYMSAIFFHDAEQEALCQQSLDKNTMNGLFRLPTQLLPLVRFYQAEAYHQKYHLREHTAIMLALRELFPDDDALVRSTVAARLNGVLGGFGEQTFEAEISGLGLPAPLAQRLITLTKDQLPNS